MKNYDGFWELLRKEFPLLDQAGLNEEEHCGEWAIQQDRKRLHTILTAAGDAQPTAPAGMVLVPDPKPTAFDMDGFPSRAAWREKHAEHAGWNACREAMLAAAPAAQVAVASRPVETTAVVSTEQGSFDKQPDEMIQASWIKEFARDYPAAFADIVSTLVDRGASYLQPKAAAAAAAPAVVVDEASDGYYLASFKQPWRGGPLLWWGPNNAGYTTDLQQAGIYTELTPGYHDSEHTVPVPMSFVRGLRIRHEVDPGDSKNEALWTAEKLRAALTAAISQGKSA